MVCWAALCAVSVAGAQGDVPNAVSAAPGPKPPTLTVVETGPLTLSVDQPGRIGSARTTLLRYEPEVFDGQATLAQIVAKPGVVRVGDVIAQLKGKDFEKKLSDFKTQVAEASERLAVLVEEQALSRASEATNLERAERAALLAAQRLTLLREYHNARDLEFAALQLKNQEDSLKEQGEELGQLQRMYSDATLETETKDIVLGRAIRALDRSRIYSAYARKDHDLFLAIDHPNAVKEIEDNARYAQQSLDHMRTRQKLQTVHMRLALAGAQRALDELTLRLSRFESDGASLTLKASVDGVLALTLPEVGEPVQARAVLATIVDPALLEVTGSFDLDALRVVEAGSQVTAWIPARPASTGTLVIDELSPIGSPDGAGAKYPFSASVRARDGAWPIGAEAHITATRVIADCTLVDTKAIKARAGAAGTWAVDLWIDGNKVTREIRIGASDGSKTQVLSGLAVGDRVVLADG